MFNEYDDFENEMVDLVDDEYDECLDCPYLLRQLPYQPQMPPRPQYPGGYGRPPFGRPPGPPPSRIPFKPTQYGAQAVSPGSIRVCVNRFVYIWLDNGRSYWAWLTRVDRRTASGFRWQGRRWVYFGVDLRRIDSFECY